MRMPPQKIVSKAIAIVGPTACGKSDIAIAIAKKYNGEIISCDSRQVYRGMDIGTGKVVRDPEPPKTFQCAKHATEKRHIEPLFSGGVRHHLLNIVSPNTHYNVVKFQKKANRIIQDILKRGKVPILCGGTGLWAQAVVENMHFPKEIPNPRLRSQLSKKTTRELFAILQKKDPDRSKKIDPNNRHRLIRAIEITYQKMDAEQSVHFANPSESKISWLVIAIHSPKEILASRIETRLDNRIANGMAQEILDLRAKGVSWTRLLGFGLEYRWMSRYLRREISFTEARNSLLAEIRHYAKRQLTWLRRWEKMGRTLCWAADLSQSMLFVQKFLKKE